MRYLCKPLSEFKRGGVSSKHEHILNLYQLQEFYKKQYKSNRVSLLEDCILINQKLTNNTMATTTKKTTKKKLTVEQKLRAKIKDIEAEKDAALMREYHSKEVIKDLRGKIEKQEVNEQKMRGELLNANFEIDNLTTTIQTILKVSR